jgi:cytochrome c-type biogenesis protein CcmH/NrfG
VAFAILSSLVVCSMLAYTFASLSLDQFPWEDSPDETDQANVSDPNQDVIADQQTAVADNPNDVEEMLLLANLLGNSGRLTEAIPWYERVLEARPEDVKARVDFARALADGGLASDAELQFTRALQVDPRSQEAHFYLAELYGSSTPRRVAEAVREYREARAIDPTTFLGQQAEQALNQLGVARPVGSPSPIATPEAISTP